MRSLIALALGVASFAQPAGAGLEGTWQGTLHAGGAKLRLALSISKASDGLYLGSMTSIDQGGARIPIDVIRVTGDSVRLELKTVAGTFEGTLDGARTRLKGTWTQGAPLPLEFVRTAEAPQPAKPAAAPASPDEGLPLDLDVPVPPTPFTGGGKTHLVYELHLTNFGRAELLLTRLEVLAEGRPVASFEGAELNGVLLRPGLAQVEDKRALGPGLRAVACVWVSLEEGARVPAVLRHRIAAGGRSVEGGTAPVAGKALILAPPVRGSDWLAANGPSNTNFHRRALIPLQGRVRIPQRFAIDWLQVYENGGTFKGAARDNKNYRAYGAEVLAVADGVVAAVQDGIPENLPGPASRAVPMTLETVGGNYVVLDLGGGRFAFYAHLQPGSLRVRRGDRVRRGQALGLLGNSGNSTEPHLHFHVGDAASPLGAEGLPYAIDSFEELNGAAPGPRRNALPLQNARVRFGEGR